MNHISVGQRILQALNDIEDTYIDSAWSKLNNVQELKKKKTDLSMCKRAAILFAALILAASTTAMAFNKEFRETVKEVLFEFFQIEEKEMLPDLSVEETITSENMYVEQDRSILGDVIEGRYIHAPASSHAREGIFTVCTDEIELRQGSHYDAYYEENGEFILLEKHLFEGTYSLLGKDYFISFEWAVHDGQLAVTHIEPEVEFRIPANPGNADAILLELLSAENAYPVELNLYTGELTDHLAGTGAEQLTGICNYAISEDRTKMLLAETNGELYYVDLVGKKLYSINELSGKPTDSCSLIDNTLSYWAEEDDGYRGWSIDLSSFEKRELFSGLKRATTETGNSGILSLSGFNASRHWGTMYKGAEFALIRDSLGAVSVLDLKNGENVPVDGFIWPENWYQDIMLDMSPDGKRILISGGQIGVNYEYIAVLDYEKQTFLEFSRENPNQVHENTPYWFDKDTVIIPASPKDSYHVQDYYVYDLLGEQHLIIEGMTEKIDTVLYQGSNYTLQIPEKEWIQQEPGKWIAEKNSSVCLWIVDNIDGNGEALYAELSEAGFPVTEDKSDFYIFEDENHLIQNVRLFENNNKLTAVFYQYPVEALEGFGVRLEKIVSSFSFH